MNPLVTVVIPVYNGAQTIPETLKSVLNQTLKEIEVLVINDGSQDRTLEVLQQFKDERVKVYSFKNAGPAASRNQGLRLAQADYISFIDADDLWTEDKLAAQYEALQQNPQAAVAYSWTHFIDETGAFLYSGQKVIANGQVYRDLLAYNFIESGSNALVRTEALQTVGGFDESLFGSEDWDAFLQLATHYDFINVPKFQILYRVSATSVSSQIERQVKACLAVLEKAFKSHSDLPVSLKRRSFANTYFYLTIKALEGQPDRKRAWLAAQFLSRIAWYQPSLFLQRNKVLSIMGAKVAIALVFDSSQARIIWKQLKQLRSKS
ncbi:MAG: glycosyltransferase [Spirulinaceae cyanobacterium]